MPRPTVARIDLDALRSNYRTARAKAGSARAMAVVKADGYGHGIQAVAGALADDVETYAVACIEEAEAIRAGALRHRGGLLQGVLQGMDRAGCHAAGLDPVFHWGHRREGLGRGLG